MPGEIPAGITAHYQREMGLEKKLYQMNLKTFPSLTLPWFYPPANLTFFFFPVVLTNIVLEYAALL